MIFSEVSDYCEPLNKSTNASTNKLDDNTESIRHIAYSIVAPTIVVIGILGNILNLFVLTRNFLKGGTRVFLTALAFSDLSVMITVIPMVIRLNNFHGRTISSAFFHAHVEIFLTNIFIGSSVFIVVCLTIERYFSVCLPTTFRNVHTKRNARKAILGSYITSILVSIPLIILKSVCVIESNGGLDLATQEGVTQDMVTLGKVTDSIGTISHDMRTISHEIDTIPERIDTIPQGINTISQGKGTISQGINSITQDISTISQNKTTQDKLTQDKTGPLRVSRWIDESCNKFSFRENTSITKTVYWSVYLGFSECIVRIGPCFVLSILNILIIRKFRVITAKRRLLRAALYKGKYKDMFSYNKDPTFRKSLKNRRYQEEKRLIRLLRAIVILFFVTMTPSAILSLVYSDKLEASFEFQVFRAAANNLELANFALNFYVYCLCSKEFRLALVKVFTGCFSCEDNLGDVKVGNENYPSNALKSFKASDFKKPNASI